MDRVIINDIVNELHTIQDMLRWAVSSFVSTNIWYGHGTDNPWDEAVQLILLTIDLPLNFPKEMYNVRLTSNERYCIVDRVMRRINERIPVAYLTNKAWFCGHEFYVDERVLVPRSPISELINQKFTGLLKKSPQYILDMCTGSACIAVSCAYIFPYAEVDAVDISLDALLVAEKNIEEHGLIHQITPICSDLFCNLPKLQYDLIVTNPPYVDSDSMDNLPSEYHHEPVIGLLAGNDSLKLVKQILACASDYLQEWGILICEVGDNMTYLIDQYPDILFNWLEFNNGGDGVFMLTRQQLIHAQDHFKYFKN